MVQYTFRQSRPFPIHRASSLSLPQRCCEHQNYYQVSPDIHDVLHKPDICKPLRIFWSSACWESARKTVVTPQSEKSSRKPHKNKIGTPPPQNPKYPPPPKRRNFMDIVFPAERIFPGAHKIGAAISGPRIAGQKF